MNREIETLRSRVKFLTVCYIVALVTYVLAIIIFQVQYSQIRSYYQVTSELNQEILLNQKWLNSELQRSLSMIEEIQND